MRVLLVKNKSSININLFSIGIIATVITNSCIGCFLHSFDISSTIFPDLHIATLSTITINFFIIIHNNAVRFIQKNPR